MDGMPYTLKLPEFEGPLDLLVHLIEKDKVDIYDIPIESITEQYIAYLDSMQEYDLDGASEFLLMAAMLLQIKSRMLLPKDEDDEGEEGGPRQMLVEMLLVYRQFKKRAELLRECMSQASLLKARPPLTTLGPIRKVRQYKLADLLRPLANLIPEPQVRPAVIPRQEFHVQDKMAEILERLSHGSGKLVFSEVLHAGRNRSEAIASFLAVLELLRLKKIDIEQQGAFAPIYMYRREVIADGTE